MFSNKGYSDFKSILEPIVNDCRVLKPTKENFLQNKYYAQRGLLKGTSHITYAYDKEKVDSYTPTFLKLAKFLPKVQGPTDAHSGIILSMDLFTNVVENPVSLEETQAQINLANHFINFLLFTNIAKPCNFRIQDTLTLALAIDKKHRAFMEQDGQEPADD